MVELIEIIQGHFDNWVRFDPGRTVRNPTLSSWRRLLRLLSDGNQIEIEFIPDDYGMIIRGWRK